MAANARERKRMHLLNKAYDQLRLRLIDAENKSKYDVLVQATEYIQALATIRDNFDKQQQQDSEQLDTTTLNLDPQANISHLQMHSHKTSDISANQQPINMSLQTNDFLTTKHSYLNNSQLVSYYGTNSNITNL